MNIENSATKLSKNPLGIISLFINKIEDCVIQTRLNRIQRLPFRIIAALYTGEKYSLSRIGGISLINQNGNQSVHLFIPFQQIIANIINDKSAETAFKTVNFKRNSV